MEKPLYGRTRYLGLDGLRAVATLLVFVNHYDPRPTNRWISFLASQGFCGVQIFFVLSGFLITGILWDSRSEPHRLRDFYARRALRILPVYYAFWLLVLLVLPIAGWPWAWHWLIYLVHLGNFVPLLFDTQRGPYAYRVLIGSNRLFNDFHVGHFWSLCVEEQFYLVWPWLVYRCKTRPQLRNLCIGFIAFAAVARVVSSFTLPQYKLDLGAVYFSTFSQIDALALGGLLAVVLRGELRGALERRNAAVTTLLLCAPLAYLATYLHLYGISVGAWNRLMSFAMMPCYDLLGLALVIRAIHPGSEIQRLFSWKPLATFGTLTYGFYIFHNVPIPLYIRIGHRLAPGSNGPAATAVVAFLATLLVAWLSFRFYESPLLRLKRKFAHQNHHAPVA